jgi:septal ring factor EnvC (AmiA/AmiB activator)
LAEVDKIAKRIDELEVVEDKLMVMAGEREAERELEAITVGEEAEMFGKSTLTLPDGLREYHGYIAEHRGAEFMAPIGEPVSGGWLSRGFGERVSLGPKGFHPGVDIAIPEGTNVRATAPGVVIFAGNDPVYGNLVILEHALTGYSTFYGHNKKLKVKVGDEIKRGGIIALSGNTGESSAPHLHYEVRLHGVPVNPLKYIKRPGEVIFADFTPATPEIVPAEETKITEEKAEPEKETPPAEETDTETPPPADDGGAIPESETPSTENEDSNNGE